MAKPDVKYHVKDSGVDGRITLRWVFTKWDVEAGTVSIWLRLETSSGHLRMT